MANLRSWIKDALSEPDGGASASRLLMLLWGVSLVVVFSVTCLWETVHTNKMPDVSTWATFVAGSQAAGALGYVGNMLRRAKAPQSNGEETP